MSYLNPLFCCFCSHHWHHGYLLEVTCAQVCLQKTNYLCPVVETSSLVASQRISGNQWCWLLFSSSLFGLSDFTTNRISLSCESYNLWNIKISILCLLNLDSASTKGRECRQVLLLSERRTNQPTHTSEFDLGSDVWTAIYIFTI
jgi:hypothetical protein